MSRNFSHNAKFDNRRQSKDIQRALHGLRGNVDFSTVEDNDWDEVETEERFGRNAPAKFHANEYED